MRRATLLRYAVLGGLLLFVAWFGVWQVWVVLAPAWGALWAGVLAGLALLGLGIIAVAGAIVIRTRDRLDRAAGTAIDERPGESQE